jgi:hypothetical protein
MKFVGNWLTQSETLLYRVMPKCACSTIGQVMYFSDHGAFYNGDIHDAADGIWKWPDTNSDAIPATVRTAKPLTFTAVRNPYARILSCYLEKICGIQRDGRPYRNTMVQMLHETYGIDIRAEADQIASFRRFLLFARDTFAFAKPFGPDIHWLSMADHARALLQNGGQYDQIFHIEAFDAGMHNVMQQITPRHPVDLGKVPRFNESAGHGAKRQHPIAAYFDDLSQHLMYQMYRQDFALFRYDFANPANQSPLGPLDVADITLRLGDPHKPHWTS